MQQLYKDHTKAQPVVKDVGRPKALRRKHDSLEVVADDGAGRIRMAEAHRQGCCSFHDEFWCHRRTCFERCTSANLQQRSRETNNCTEEEKKTKRTRVQKKTNQCPGGSL